MINIMDSTEQPSVIVATSNQTPTDIPPNKSVLEKIILSTGIIVVLLIVIGGYQYLNINKEKQTTKTHANSFQTPTTIQLSPTILSQTTPAKTNSNWKTLTSTSCYLAIKYPDNWNSKIQETKYGCSITIEHPTIKSTFLILSRAQDTTWDKVLTENNDAQKTTIAGVDGLITKAVTDPSGSMNGFYFHKENSIYNGVYTVDSAYPDIKNTFEEIISTIQLTGKQSDYQSIVNVGEDIQNSLNQAKDVGVKTDIGYLQSAIENYKIKYNTFPESLQILVDNQLIKKILVNPYTNLPYEYINDGQIYSISGKLHDGIVYKLP